MRILVVGSGGRENALAWKLAQSRHELFCAPGNGGICQIAECVEIDPLDITGLVDFAARGRMDLTIVGPEAPLVAGIADEFAEAGLALFGPSKAAARLEGDKAFAKQLMRETGIPTAEFEVLSDYEQARQSLEFRELPVVVKASGLAAGKGAVICREREEAEAALNEMMVDARFGEAGKTVVIEDFLEGEEVSVIGLCDGKRIEMLLPSQDHKPLLDGDQGPNTGGMGAYAPAPVVTEVLSREIEETVFKPLLAGFEKAGIEYRGAIYAGMMLTRRGPKVLEFNCRFGDPETQAVMPLLRSDLAELCLACAQGGLAERHAEWSDRWALCVVAASEGYPGAYKKGLPITGRLAGTGSLVIFHAGTRIEDEKLVTSGGRVLGVTGVGESLKAARDHAYAALKQIQFEGMYFRKDIGARGLERLGSLR